MRLVVCLFAESRQLLPVNDPIYAQAYGVRSLYELLDEATRNEGGTHVLFNRQMAWSRLMALFRLIHGGSSHGAFAMRAYGGALFRPGDAESSDPVARALHILEHAVSVGDATIYHVLRKLLAWSAAGGQGAPKDLRGWPGRLHRPPHRVHRPDLRRSARLPPEANRRADRPAGVPQSRSRAGAAAGPAARTCWPTTARA